MPDNKVSLVLVVNGTETRIDANLNAPLQVVAQHALNNTGDQGRPLSEWELKDDQGRTLDLSRKVKDFGFGDGSVLYLTLAVGVNGALPQ